MNPMKTEIKDKIPGGLADNMEPERFDREALQQGLKVELEHTSDPSIALEIAMDHLAEDPDYYKKLSKIHTESEDKPDGVEPEPENFEKVLELSGSNHLAIVDASVIKNYMHFADVPGVADAVFIPTKTSTEQPVQFKIKAEYDDASLRSLTLAPVSAAEDPEITPEEDSEPEPTSESAGGVTGHETKAQRAVRGHTSVKSIKRNENQRDAAKGGRGPRFDVPDPEKKVKSKIRRTNSKNLDLNGVARETYRYLGEVKSGAANPGLLEDKYGVRSLLSDLMGVCVGRIDHPAHDSLDFDLIYEAWKSVDDLIKDSRSSEIIKIEESIERGDLV